jgi:patatin-like phospholipase/acyl hydrolase
MSKAFRILAIDGGGIRGIIPAVWLEELQDRLGEKRLCEAFDLVVGTSTGSILAAAVATDTDISQAFDLYREFGPRIFDHRDFRRSFFNFFTAPIYKTTELTSALQRVFSRGDKLGQHAKTRLCITSYDVFNRQAYLMKSYDPDFKDIPIWEACKASCSAPSYFPAHMMNVDGAKIPLIDGGVAANNPAIVALSEAVSLIPGDSFLDIKRDVQIISLGTGSLTRRISASDAQRWGPANWALPIIDVLFDASSELTDRILNSIIPQDNYVRMQIVLSEGNDDLDDASRKNMDELQALARGYLQTSEGRRALNDIVSMID